MFQLIGIGSKSGRSYTANKAETIEY